MQAMNNGKTIFAWGMSFFNEYEFKKCGDCHVIKFNCRDQFMAMSFAQFADKASLIVMETLHNLGGDRYCSGLKMMPRYMLANAHEKKDGCIYHAFAIESSLAYAEIYRNVCSIELLSKWITWYIHIGAFIDFSWNAVYSPIGIAVCDYLLIIAIKIFVLFPRYSSIGQVLFLRTLIRDLYNHPTVPVLVLEAGPSCNSNYGKKLRTA